MFSSSSKSSVLYNPDGSWNVYCYSCSHFIARTFTRINRSLCEMCRRIEEGEPIDEQSIQAYELSKLGKAEVSGFMLKDETPEAAKKFSLRSLAGEFKTALQFLKPIRPEAVESKKTAKTKRRAPLFSDIQLGTMSEMDEKLKEQK